VDEIIPNPIVAAARPSPPPRSRCSSSVLPAPTPAKLASQAVVLYAGAVSERANRAQQERTGRRRSPPPVASGFFAFSFFCAPIPKKSVASLVVSTRRGKKCRALFTYLSQCFNKSPYRKRRATAISCRVPFLLPFGPSRSLRSERTSHSLCHYGFLPPFCSAAAQLATVACCARHFVFRGRLALVVEENSLPTSKLIRRALLRALRFPIFLRRRAHATTE